MIECSESFLPEFTPDVSCCGTGVNWPLSHILTDAVDGRQTDVGSGRRLWERCISDG